MVADDHAPGVRETSASTDAERLTDRLANAVNDSGVALWERTVDMEPVWVTENFAEIAGFSVNEWQRFPNIDSIHPEDVEVLERHLADQNTKIRAGEEVPLAGVDYRYRAPDGTVRTVNALMGTAEQDGAIVIRGRTMDVTEERAREAEVNQRNEELGRVNRSLSEFTQVVSHDLRAPLRHIVALASFAREDAGDQLPDSIDSRLTQIEERVRAMSSLIDDLLDYARSGTLRTQATTADLQTLVADTVDLVGDRAGIEISIEADSGPVTTHAIPLSTCIRNLVDNAVKHHPGPEGTVTVQAWRQGPDLLMITVADDGDGIDAVNHERIFEPMQSLGQGTGLGLSTIKKIVEERGGSISLDSEPGRGAAFTFAWPLQSIASGSTATLDEESLASD